MTTYNTPLPFHELTNKIIGIYYSVLSSFSAPQGIPENIFRDKFALALQRAGFKTETEKDIPMHDQEVRLGALRADIVVNGLVVIEIKNVGRLTKKQMEQGTNYMDYGGYPVGLIFNYGQPKAKPKRIKRPASYHKEPKKCPGSK